MVASLLLAMLDRAAEVVAVVAGPFCYFTKR
jgi:hypothetical protein